VAARSLPVGALWTTSTLWPRAEWRAQLAAVALGCQRTGNAKWGMGKGEPKERALAATALLQWCCAESRRARRIGQY